MIDIPYRPELDVAPELLADLYDSRPLVITPDYIGIERRRRTRQPWRTNVRAGHGLHVGQIVITALVTTAFVASIGLLSTSAPAPALPVHSTALAHSTAQNQRHALLATGQLARSQQRQAATSARAAHQMALAQQRKATATARAERQVALAQQRQAAAAARADRQLARIQQRQAAGSTRAAHQVALAQNRQAARATR